MLEPSLAQFVVLSCEDWLPKFTNNETEPYLEAWCRASQGQEPPGPELVGVLIPPAGLDPGVTPVVLKEPLYPSPLDEAALHSQDSMYEEV